MLIQRQGAARPFRRARIWLVATSVLSTGIALPAHAQTVLLEPPPYASYDENGVDLATLALLSDSGDDISIGSSNGMSYRPSYLARLETSNLDYRIVAKSGGLVTVRLGTGADQFKLDSSGIVYESLQKRGATLTRVMVGATPNWTYTAADGTKILFNQGTVGCQQGTCAVPDYVLKPNGERLKFYVQAQTYCVDQGSPCEQYITTQRVMSVVSNYGYQIKFTYDFNGAIPYDDGSTPQAWLRRVKAQAINNAVEYCSPTASTCTLTQSWPSASYAYSSSGGNQVVNATDSESRTTRYTYSAGSLIGIKRPTASTDTTTYSYSGSGLTLTNERGSFTYTSSITGTTRTVTVSGPESYARTITSDTTTNRILTDTDGLGRTIAYQYDTAARPTRVTQPEGNYTQLTYDARGNVTETRRVAKAGSGDADIVTSAAFASTCASQITCNKPTSTTDARGAVTDYSYDGTHGGLLTVTAPAPSTGAIRPQTRYSYTSLSAYVKNAGGFIVATGAPIQMMTKVSTCQTSASCADAADETKTVIAYGSAGVANNLLPSSIASGSGDGTLTATTSATWDQVGNLTAVDGPLAGTADTTSYRYNAVREPVGTISADPDGADALKRRALRVTYNADGQPAVTEVGTVNGTSDGDWAAFASAQQLTVSYDSKARPDKEVVTAGGSTYAVTQYGYDAASRPTCVAQRMNSASWGSLPSDACTSATTGAAGPDRIARTVYDVASQVTTQQSAYGTTAQADTATLTYTPNGQTQTLIDGEGNKTSYEYDGHDRLAKLRYPLATAGSGASSTTDYEGYVYDANGNVIERRLRGYASDSSQKVGYTFDNLNRMTAKNLPGSEPDVSYSYDLLGRLTAASQTGNALSFSYDALSRNLTQGGPLGTVSYQYDLAGRRTRLIWPDAVYVTYDHLVTGEVTHIRENGASSGAGVLATFGYDDLGRRTSLTRGNGTVTGYGYDPVSRLASLEQNLAGTVSDVTATFTYNPASQIIAKTRSNDLYAFPSFANINRTDTINGLNQVTATGGTAVNHDARGNVSAIGSSSYGYSSENLLKTGPSGATLSYDPLLRLYETSPSATRFQYDGLDLITEFSGSNAVARRYVHGPGMDEPLVWYEGSGTSDRRWLHADERGSIVAITDGSGAVISGGINSYDDYGVPAAGNVGRFQYTGQSWLPDVDLYYYKARMYAPSLGRFMQTDPIGYEGGLNLYAYVQGDPVNLRDPLGLNEDEITIRTKRLRDEGPSWGPLPVGVWYFPGPDPSGGDGGTVVVVGRREKCSIANHFCGPPPPPLPKPVLTPQKQKKNSDENYSAWVNYCGGKGGMSVPNDKINEACFRHDVCYGGSGVARSTCDLVFAVEIFGRRAAGNFSTWGVADAAIWALIYGSAVSTQGKKYYVPKR